MAAQSTALDYSIVIPARYHSTRLPGKPLLDICGKPLLRHVYERATESKATEIVIATDDDRIKRACAEFGAECLMTSTEHVSGTDRLAEVAAIRAWPQERIIVNLQGDEPMIPASLLDAVASQLHQHNQASMATLCEKIATENEYHDPNCVKVVIDQQGYALYFSRSPLPYYFPEAEVDSMSPGVSYRHIGLYAYRAGYLKQFAAANPTLLEQSERLEQLRALEMGEKIFVMVTDVNTGIGVDTQEDLNKARELLCS